MDIYRKLYKGKNNNIYFMEQLSEVDRDMATASEEERNAKKIEIIRHMGEILGKAYPDLLNNRNIAYSLAKEPDSVKVIYELEDESGNKVYLKTPLDTYSPYIGNPALMKKEMIDINVREKTEVNKKFAKPLSDLALLDANYIDAHRKELEEGYIAAANWVAKNNWYDLYAYDKEAKNKQLNAKGEYGNFDYEVYKLENGEYKKLSETEQDALTTPIPKYKFNGMKKIFKEEYDSTLYKSVMKDIDIIEVLKEANFNTTEDADYAEGRLPKIAKQYLADLKSAVQDSETGNTLPREALEKVIGKPIKVTGLTLQRDTIPAIDKAVFAQYKTKINKKLGVQAWFLHSLNDKNIEFKSGFMESEKKTIHIQTGTGPITYDEDGYEVPGDPIYEDREIELTNPINHTYTSSKLANVFSIGLQYQLGNSTLLSIDYGQNRTDFGRYMNGHTNYEHTPGTADFKLKGHSMGGTPHFWTARLDIGQSDYTRPGSWNAFMDYKYFAHGSFFGGNGTGAVPDRYLDGVRSFTLGGGYVPRKDLLLEAFYTFDAKGIGQRDTLYGGENFKLGNYTRIQGTYKF